MQGRKAILKMEDWRYLLQRWQKEVRNAVTQKVLSTTHTYPVYRKKDTASQENSYY